MDPINKIYPLYVSSQKKPAPAGSVMGYLSLVEWVDLNSFCLSCHGGWDSWDSDISWRKIEVHVVNMETTVKTVVCQPCVSMVTDPDWITHTTNSHMALSIFFFAYHPNASNDSWKWS